MPNKPERNGWLWKIRHRNDNTKPTPLPPTPRNHKERLPWWKRADMRRDDKKVLSLHRAWKRWGTAMLVIAVVGLVVVLKWCFF